MFGSKFNIKKNNLLFTDILDLDLFFESFNSKLSKLIEKQDNRKEKGSYYTPNDICNYIVNNTYMEFLNPSNKLYSDTDFFNSNYDTKTLHSLIFKKTVLDPTAGAGEFYLTFFNSKYNLLKSINQTISDADIINIVSTLYANDIDEIAIDVIKIRAFFYFYSLLTDKTNIDIIVSILNNNITNFDFGLIDINNFSKYDFLIGNPPYIEYSKSNNYLYDFGNLYGDILANSTKVLNIGGSIGYIIPISFVSTIRMSKLRDIIQNSFKKIKLSNYADRPSSLFSSVHQKLTILIGNTYHQNINSKVFTSGYHYFNSDERLNIFKTIDLVSIDEKYFGYIPKIENKIEKSIFMKITKQSKVSLFDCLNALDFEENELVYLNMRATFYIKAFSFPMKSSEYNVYNVNRSKKYYILSILNSSFFFLFWNMISDCWHITNKELKEFKVINIDNFIEIDNAYKELERKLEETKVFINTKQTDYAYKHKLCINEIHKIDYLLSKIYNFDDTELEYIKNYAFKHKIGDYNV
jgi:hypothetical protein